LAERSIQLNLGRGGVRPVLPVQR